MTKKYEFTGETKEYAGRTLKRIRAIVDFGKVKAGTIGGWIETEDNLSHSGLCWVADEAMAYGKARIYHNVLISDQAQVFGRAEVCQLVHVYDQAHVFDQAQVRGCVKIGGLSSICGNTILSDF